MVAIQESSRQKPVAAETTNQQSKKETDRPVYTNILGLAVQATVEAATQVAEKLRTQPK